MIYSVVIFHFYFSILHFEKPSEANFKLYLVYETVENSRIYPRGKYSETKKQISLILNL